MPVAAVAVGESKISIKQYWEPNSQNLNSKFKLGFLERKTARTGSKGLGSKKQTGTESSHHHKG